MTLSSRSKMLATLAACAASLLVATPASAASLYEAVSRAIARSPEIAGLASQVEVQKAREEFAGHGYLPQLSVDAGTGGEYSNLLGRGAAAQFRSDAGANLTQVIWDWQRIGHGVTAANRRAAAALLDVSLAREKLAYTTSEAYLNVLRRRLLLRQTQLNITYHRWLVDTARERVAKKQLAMPRLTELEARLAPLTVERIQQEADYERARLTLVELAGEGADAGAAMPPEVMVDHRAAEDINTYVRETVATHPAVLRATLLADAARSDLDAARAAYLPSLDANLSTRYLDDAEGLRGLQWDNLAMVRVNWALFGQGVPAQVREAEAASKVADAQLAQTRMELSLDMRRSATSLKALEEQDRVLVGYQQAARFSMEAGMDYFKKTAHFATDMLALADLINVRYQAEANLISNHIDRQVAELQLLQSAGKLVPALKQVFHT